MPGIQLKWTLANSVDQDQIAQNAASDQNPHPFHLEQELLYQGYQHFLKF